jgi:hypothetical protein
MMGHAVFRFVVVDISVLASREFHHVQPEENIHCLRISAAILVNK